MNNFLLELAKIIESKKSEDAEKSYTSFLLSKGFNKCFEGFLKDKNYFTATKILAKHDENYMPPEVKEAIGVK